MEKEHANLDDFFPRKKNVDNEISDQPIVPNLLFVDVFFGNQEPCKRTV